MAYRVVLTDKAEADIESILKWFCTQRAISAGSRWYSQFMAKLDTLEDHPERCALAFESEEVGQEIRELLLGRRGNKYRILFTIGGKLVVILRVWHASRDFIKREDLAE